MRRTLLVLLALALALTGLTTVVAPDAMAAAPANDSLGSAAPLTVGTVTVNNVEATNAVDEPAPQGVGCNTLKNSVWFTFTPSADESRTFETSGPTSGDTVLRLFTGPSVMPTPGSLTHVGCDDDANTGNYSRLVRSVVSGTTYYLQVGTFRDAPAAPDPGPFEFSLTTTVAAPGMPPANDNLAAAASLSSGTVTVDNRNATNEGTEPNGQGGCTALNNSVWFTFTPGANGTRTLETSGPAGGDTVVRLFSGPSVMPTPATLTFVGCNDDGGEGNYSLLNANVVASTTYYVQVGTFRTVSSGADPGPLVFSLSFRDPATDPPANDLVANPTTIPVGANAVSGTFAGSTVNATETGDEPTTATGGRSIWFSWIAPWAGPVVFDTSPSTAGLDTYLCAFAGTGAVTLETALACSDDVDVADPRSAVRFDVEPGATYRIMVGTALPGPGAAVAARWAYQPPGNDARSAATPISGASGNVPSYVRFATSEPSDPPINISGGGQRSTWFAWTPDVDGPVAFETTSAIAGTDTILAVYVPDPMNETGLSRIALNDDNPGTTLARLDFVADDAITYLVRVDGFSVNDSDPHQLVWSPYDDAAATVTEATPGEITNGSVVLSVATTLVEAGGLDLSGQVTVTRGAQVLDSVATADGTAVLSVPLEPGQNNLTVTYAPTDYHVAGSTDTVQVTYAAPTTTSLVTFVSGRQVTLDAAVALSQPVDPFVYTGTVEFFEGSTSLGSQPVLPEGHSEISLPNVRPGSHTYRAVFTPSGDDLAGSSSPTRSVTIPKTASKTTIAGPARVRAGAKPKLTVTVKSGAANAAGKVKITLGGKVLKTLSLKKGKVSITLPALKVGKAKIVASYLGNATTKPSKATKTITVTRA